MRVVRWATCVVVAGALAACASASKKAPAESASAAPAQDAVAGGYAAPASAQPPPPPSDAPAPSAVAPTKEVAKKAEAADAAPGRPPAQGAPTPPLSRAAALAQARRELDAASRELDVAAGDCRNACRALASMDRAAGRICALADPGERRCDRAKETLVGSRDRVRQTCGECPGGPSVEHDAPVPSVR